MTTTAAILEQRLSEQIGDWLEFDTTTGHITGVTITSTELTAYDSGQNDYFNDWWLYITEGDNAAIQRQVSDYATSGGVLTVRGANLTTANAAITCRLHRYNRDLYIRAFNDTNRELSSYLFKRLDVAELVAGNILPNSHFRDWAATTAPDKYAMIDSNITAVAETGAGNCRGGGKSMKATTGASGAGKYVYITSNSYPRLLDLMGKTVSFYCWAKPDTANDATIEIYTLQASGVSTAQTLTSTTLCPINYFTLLKLENQALNDDLVEIQFRFKVATLSKNVYFDHARVIGGDVSEYLLPTDFKNGSISQVDIQSSGYSDETCDDLLPEDWSPVYAWDIIDDGTDKFLRLNEYWTTPNLIRLRGKTPLSAVSAFTSTIEIDGDLINRYIAYAKYKLYQMIEGPVAVRDIGRYETESAKAYNEYLRLGHLRMTSTPPRMKIAGY